MSRSNPRLLVASDPDRPRTRPPRRRSSRWRRIGYVLLFVLAALAVLRLFLPGMVRWYVIRTLDRNPMYDGLIGDVHLHLWRGAYSIDDVRLIKTTGNVPVPFFAARRVDLAVEWPALMSGQLVGRMVMEQPELNFVDADESSRAQSGSGGPWLELIRDLFPFRINSAEVRDGSIHFRAFHHKPHVDVYLSRVAGSVENLTNIHDDVTPLVSRVHATALAMDDAHLDFDMSLDPFSYRPSFKLALTLIGLDVTKTNALARSYGRVDFERGWFDLVVELEAREGTVEGYVKPLFRKLVVLDLGKDLQEGNVFQVFWEALVGVASKVLTNQAREQVATVIPLRGRISGPRSDVLAAIGNLLRNAFVRAYLPRLQGTPSDADRIDFGPGSPVERAASAPGK